MQRSRGIQVVAPRGTYAITPIPRALTLAVSGIIDVGAERLQESC